ncbi:TonB-dependent receptor plug domain-containing protein [Aliikangiella coralliicola]|uniref:TonB-dependent receptor n=1 Tax=Aliikangiella coralliicola TaxID=2592383 RepID=A0A545UB22_9GAMM|nr:TonB-dependent receptor [Aliikangiella coralliicola]TQV86661.1 hypothetical protein FLL46_17360 [Aliikangiella coralliicola]
MIDINRKTAFRRSALAAFIASNLLTAGSIYAAEDETDGAKSKDDNKITVTGSRIKRSEAEGAAPIIRITSQDMTDRGYVTVFDALKNLSQNTGFQFEGPESQLFTPDVQTVNLRSTGVGNTLVLINGRRIANYPAAYQASTSVVNFGAIPAAAVEEVQVLATGASAIYGSDAVAGVINIILKTEIDGTSLNLLVGGPTETKTDRNTTRFQLVTGHSFESGNITATFEYQKRDPILAGDYDEFDSDLDYPYGDGVLLRNNLDLDYWALNGWALDSTGQGYRDPGVGACAALGNGTERSFRNNRGYFCGKDSAAETNFRNEREHYSVFASGNYYLENDVELFGDLVYYTSDSVSNNNGLWISEDIYDTSTPRSTVFGTFGDWYLGQRRFTEEELGRSLDQTFDDTAISLSVGARGSWGLHDWEVSLTQSDYELNYQQPWWKAESVVEVFLGDYNGVGFFGDNWWAGNGTFGLQTGATGGIFTPIDQALVNSAIDMQRYSNETSSTSAQFVLNGDLVEMADGPLSYALVVEWEEQDFAFVPDARLQQDPIESYLSGSGWWNLTGFSGAGDRSRAAVGLETRIPVSSDLTLSVAARTDNYDSTSSSIGTRTTPSLSFEYRPLDNLLIRGGYTGSFRAPDLNMVYTRTGFFTTATDFVQCYQSFIATGGTPANFDRSTCTGSSTFVRRTPGTELSGDEALKDETGHSNWLGFAWDVSDDLLITVDYSKVRIEDQVRNESITTLLRDEFECFLGNLTGDRCDYIAPRIQREVDPTTGVSFIEEFNASPINAAVEQVRNIDVKMFSKFDTSVGQFGLNLDYTHVLSHEFKNDITDEEYVDLRDDPIQGGWGFRSILTAAFSYKNGDFSTVLTGIRRGSTTRRNPTSIGPNDDMRVDPYITFNWTAGYEFTDSLRGSVRVVNILDEGAPRDDSHFFFQPPWFNVFVYSGAQIGRELYMELDYKF